MKKLLPFLAIALIGAGCTNVTVNNPPPPADAYAGWKELQSGGIVSFKIPPNCSGDPGAGSIYIVCPTPDNDSPTPEMVIASDGETVLVHRWEDLETPIWDKVVGSLRVITPLTHPIKIEIDK